MGNPHPRTQPARFGHTLVNVDGNLHLFGGFDFTPSPSVLYNDLWRWDGSDWTELTPASPPPGRYAHSAAASGGKMYIFFGSDGAGGVYGDVWAYDPQANTWTQKLGGATGRSYAGAATLPNGHILLLGGMDAASNVLNDFWEYDPDADSFTQKPDPPMSGRYGSNVVSVNGENICTFGGHDDNNPLDEMWVYDAAEEGWEAINPNGEIPDPRLSSASAQVNGNLWFAGGEGEGYTTLQDSCEYDSDANEWTQRAPLPYPLTESSGAAREYIFPNYSGQTRLNAQTTQVVIVFGGMSDGQPISTTLRYTPAGDVNTAPTLTSFTDAIDSTTENTEVEITLAELKAQGDEADADGTVDAFMVRSVSAGTLEIGASSGDATAFAATTNDTIDSANNAYWTPATDTNGTLDAFAVAARDDDGAESATNVVAQVTVRIPDVNAGGSVDLKDAILCLKILAGLTDMAEISLAADVNSDERIGFEELFFILRKLAR